MWLAGQRVDRYRHLQTDLSQLHRRLVTETCEDSGRRRSRLLVVTASPSSLLHPKPLNPINKNVAIYYMYRVNSCNKCEDKSKNFCTYFQGWTCVSRVGRSNLVSEWVRLSFEELRSEFIDGCHSCQTQPATSLSVTTSNLENTVRAELTVTGAWRTVELPMRVLSESSMEGGMMSESLRTRHMHVFKQQLWENAS